MCVTTLIALALAIFYCWDKVEASKDMSLSMELFTSNIEESVNFYTKGLGFYIEEDSISKLYQAVHNGSVRIGFGLLSNLSEQHYFNPKLSDIRSGFGVEIVLEVDDIKATYEQVRKSGYNIHEPLQDQYWGLTDFRMIDPSGYYLRITSRR